MPLHLRVQRHLQKADARRVAIADIKHLPVVEVLPLRIWYVIDGRRGQGVGIRILWIGEVGR